MSKQKKIILIIIAIAIAVFMFLLGVGLTLLFVNRGEEVDSDNENNNYRFTMEQTTALEEYDLPERDMDAISDSVSAYSSMLSKKQADVDAVMWYQHEYKYYGGDTVEITVHVISDWANDYYREGIMTLNKLPNETWEVQGIDYTSDTRWGGND